MSKTDNNSEVLSALVAEMIAEAPFERDGFEWALASQDEFCARLGGWSISKFFRQTSSKPFVRDVAKIDGRKKTIIRTGEPGPVTHDKLAKHMSSLLRRSRDRSRKALLDERDTLSSTMTCVPEADALKEVRIAKIDHLLNVLPTLTTHSEFGCMCGLAEIWPVGHQVEIFRSVLADWPAFMAGEKVAIWETGQGQEKFFDFPSMSVLRAFPQVGLELYVMEKQAAATALTPELRLLSALIAK
ncbi:hypothetical protein [Agrobacterium rosae]|uniref:Uncharacterized protein n=1 Tax=Agrobacterium rosae TaxID=1972867 RepID=A0A1R3TYL7_9HYPH|nr:hypothetical protein [Agrobacterium rosae]SCX27118.1 hypothetical protein DSM25559_2947 [Agrobacterium rosae]